LEQPLFENDIVSRKLAKRNYVTKTMISCLQWWKHFWRYLTFLDYHESPKQKQMEDPIWNVWHLVDHLNKFLAIYEQTISFQGLSGIKLQFSYNREKGGGWVSV
jgi:hypothetical protein